MAKGANHLHVGSFSAVDPRHGQSVVAALTAARPLATVSFDPNIRPFVTPTASRDARRSAGLARPSGQGQRGRSRVALSRPSNRRQPCGLGPLRPEFLCRDARRARRFRDDRERADRGRRAEGRGGRHRRRGRQFHVCATLGDGPGRSARRRGAAPRAKRSNNGSALPRPRPRSLARARAPIHRSAPRSRRRSLDDPKFGLERRAKTAKHCGRRHERSKTPTHQQWEPTLWRRATLCLDRAGRGQCRRI